MHQQFWREQPALLVALSVLIGTSSFLFGNLLFPLLLALYLIAIRSYPQILLILAAHIYSSFLFTGTPSGTVGYFSIATLQPFQTPFHRGLIYKGMLNIDKQRVPCSIYYTGEDHPKANCDYILKGKLKKKDTYSYSFKPKEWIPVKNTWSLAELRYQTKEKCRTFLASHLHSRPATFLSSLLTGDVEDRTLRYEFGKLGLQHLLAISGFHFAILIAFCSAFLNLFLPHRWKLIVLLLAINLYFVFIGSLPAVQRAWLMASLYLIGKLIHRHATPLNLLGVALLIEILLDPLIITSLGFQLSFLSCTGILLFRPFFLFPSKTDPSNLSLLDQHIYLLSAFFRQALSVNFAVNLAILPLLLYHFHQFPLLSLLYNLFFPFLVSAALFGLLFTLLFPLPLFFPLIDLFTTQLLDLAAYPPIALDYTLKFSFPAWLIPLYLFALFCYALAHQKKREELVPMRLAPS